MNVTKPIPEGFELGTRDRCKRCWYHPAVSSGGLCHDCFEVEISKPRKTPDRRNGWHCAVCGATDNVDATWCPQCGEVDTMQRNHLSGAEFSTRMHAYWGAVLEKFLGERQGPLSLSDRLILQRLKGLVEGDSRK
jgi:hypothetical protein